MKNQVEKLVDAHAALDAIDEELQTRRRAVRRTIGLGMITAAGFAVQAWGGGLGYVLAWVVPTLGLTAGMWWRGRSVTKQLELAREEKVVMVERAPDLIGES